MCGPRLCDGSALDADGHVVCHPHGPRSGAESCSRGPLGGPDPCACRGSCGRAGSGLSGLGDAGRLGGDGLASRPCACGGGTAPQGVGGGAARSGPHGGAVVRRAQGVAQRGARGVGRRHRPGTRGEAAACSARAHLDGPGTAHACTGPKWLRGLAHRTRAAAGGTAALGRGGHTLRDGGEGGRAGGPGSTARHRCAGSGGTSPTGLASGRACRCPRRAGRAGQGQEHGGLGPPATRGAAQGSGVGAAAEHRPAGRGGRRRLGERATTCGCGADAAPRGREACATGACRAGAVAARGRAPVAVWAWTKGAHARHPTGAGHPSGHRGAEAVPAPLARVANGVGACRA